MYDLDAKKDLFEGETYRSQKSALLFLSSISDIERQQTAEMVKQATFFAFLMDGSTDIAGDGHEAIFIRVAKKGVVQERFLAIDRQKVPSLKTFMISPKRLLPLRILIQVNTKFNCIKQYLFRHKLYKIKQDLGLTMSIFFNTFKFCISF